MTDKKFDETNRRCSVAGCDRPYSCKGLCKMHYKRQWRTGTTDESDSLIGKRYVAIQDRIAASYLVNKESGCWEWTAHKSHNGYGRVMRRGKGCNAHRVTWELAHGPIPKGLIVCHKCDNPACVNPEHLFLGTHQDNENDKVAKGRQARGEKLSKAQGNQKRCGENSPTSKLTERAVRSIRADARTQRQIAASHGITQSAVYAIKNRKVWRHI